MDIRMIAHDMRTPLCALALSVAAAKEALAGDQEAARSHLDIADRNIKALSGIVDALLDTMAEGKGTLTLSEASPKDLISQAIAIITPVAAEKKLTLRASDVQLPLISVDSNRIIRVLVNLLSNAVRFSPVGESIMVDATLQSNDGRFAVIFSVSDRGPGVPENDIQRIFLRGVTSGDKERRSTGLGLTVCREIIEAHGGNIWAEPGSEGARFSFSIPIASTPAS